MWPADLFPDPDSIAKQRVGGVELSSGAISVAAPDLGAPGTFDTIIPIGTALSGAVIRIEVQDISAADGSLLAMDSVELVVQ